MGASMSGRLLDSGRHAIRIGLTMLAGWLCVACGTSRIESPPVSPVIEDSGVAQCPEKGPPTTRAELKGCVANIRDGFDTNELVGDEQRLMLNPPCPRPCTYGPLAKIEPAIGAQDYSDDELREGRIIARLSVRTGEKRYPKLALVPGYFTYWWVQRDSRQGGVSYFISEAMVGNRLMMTKSDSLKVEEYRDRPFQRAIAGWLWSDMDETAQGTCGSSSCKSGTPR
jgi:hypothetical protein